MEPGLRRPGNRFRSGANGTLIVGKWPEHIFADFPVDPASLQRGA